MPKQNILQAARQWIIQGCLAAIFILPFVAGMMYWSDLSRNVYLMDTDWPFIVAGICGLSGGCVITLISGLIWRSRFTKLKLLKLFGSSAFMLAIFSMQLPSAAVRYLPQHRLRYLTTFDISFPGPSHGKSSRCEMGLWIKDRHLQRWIQFCSSKAWMDAHYKRGMERIEIVEDVNQYGVLVRDYRFAWSPINEAGQ